MANEFDTGFGVEVPDHTILSRLGRGGMATVYLARDERLNRLVAVKVIGERFDQDAQFQRRFEREARIAAGLTHPNIVPVHSYGYTSDQRPYLSMAFLDGGTLRERLRKRGAIPVDEALGITRQMASALLAAHARNIVHRDLKPDNVMFQGDTAFLTDFGIAKLLDATTELTHPGANPGTVKYFSPEQALEQAVDQRSDIYALGVVLYEMLTGRIPIEGDTVVQYLMRISHMPPAALPAELKGLQPFMDVLLAKDPADRVATCADVIAIIQAMERNWMRFGEINRLTDGVAITPSGQARAAADLDAATQVMAADAGNVQAATVDAAQIAIAPTTAAPTTSAPVRSHGQQRQRSGPTISIADGGQRASASDNVVTVGVASTPTKHVDASVAASSMADDDAGLTDLGYVPLTAHTAAAAPAPRGERRAELAEPELVTESRVAVAKGATDPGANAVAQRSRLPLLLGIAVVTLLVVVGVLGWLLRSAQTDVATHATAEATSPGPANGPSSNQPTSAPNPGAPTTAAAANSAVTSATPAASGPSSIGPTSGVAPLGGSAPALTTGGPPIAATVPLQTPAPVSANPRAPTDVASLTVVTIPADGRITLLGVPTRYSPGMSLPAAAVRIRIEKTGYAAREARLDLKAGANRVELSFGPLAPLDNASPPRNTTVSPPVVSAPLTEQAMQTVVQGLVAQMVSIPAGKFRMGDVAGGGKRDEQPPHDVSVSAFRLSKYEVTFAQYDAFAQASGRAAPAAAAQARGQHPVVNIGSSDANAFAAWLSQKTGGHFRLPTEAEWEYAARAGGTSRYHWGESVGRGNANCATCGSAWDNKGTAPVGSFAANQFGLYDMLGNVWEWVADCYNDSYVDAPTDGGVWTKGDCSKRVLRGGSWNSTAEKLRISNRDGLGAAFRFNNNGFRLAQDM